MTQKILFIIACLALGGCSNSSDEELKNQYISSYIESTTPLFVDELKEQAAKLEMSHQQFESLLDIASQRIERMANCSYDAYQDFPKRYRDTMIRSIVKGDDIRASSLRVNQLIESDMSDGLIAQEKIIRSARRVKESLTQCMQG
ncbi:hypothetical protein M1D72_06515 [Vibrio sp. AK197]|uniref:Lipoprotein n=1 Tax=Vibrio olivae TaxID=1243002 RepID=A0ABV5HNA0_9VIBR